MSFNAWNTSGCREVSRAEVIKEENVSFTFCSTLGLWKVSEGVFTNAYLMTSNARWFCGANSTR